MNDSSNRSVGRRASDRSRTSRVSLAAAEEARLRRDLRRDVQRILPAIVESELKLALRQMLKG